MNGNTWYQKGADNFLNLRILVNRSTYTQVVAERHKGFYLAIQRMVTCGSFYVGILIQQLGKLWISSTCLSVYLKSTVKLMILLPCIHKQN
jgi:hypothetical protein